MSEKKITVRTTSTSIFLPGLQLLFLGLKLSGNIDSWSWWAVMSPTLFIASLFLIALILVLWLGGKYR